MRKTAVFLPFLLLAAAPASSECLFAIQPAITAEPGDDQGLQVNVLPFLFEKPLGDQYSLRLRSILNARFNRGPAAITGAGAGVILPFYRDPREAGKPYQGAYLGPVADLTWDQGALTATLAAETGYAFFFDPVTVNLGFQAGATHLRQNQIVPHNGVMVSVGVWR